jgi:hypothetical protein
MTCLIDIQHIRLFDRPSYFASNVLHRFVQSVYCNLAAAFVKANIFSDLDALDLTITFNTRFQKHTSICASSFRDSSIRFSNAALNPFVRIAMRGATNKQISSFDANTSGVRTNRNHNKKQDTYFIKKISFKLAGMRLL